MCRCSERREIIQHVVDAVADGDIQAAGNQAAAFVQTVRSDAADAARASASAVRNAIARLRG
ncbi:hypothetical protein FB480_103443 [Agrobacterium vitis]|nr:hypothetical protein FB480_103443 [Agrobacterium vitis]